MVDRAKRNKEFRWRARSVLDSVAMVRGRNLRLSGDTKTMLDDLEYLAKAVLRLESENVEDANG